MSENIKTDPFNKLRASTEKIKYTVRKSNRSKRMRIAVYCDTRVVVTVPWAFDDSKIEKFIKEKAWWIIKKINYFSRYKYVRPIENRRINYLKYKSTALALAKERVQRFNQFYNFRVNSINIRNQRTRWGSCSAKGNLNFNYKIALLPEHLADYIIIHELCHLREFNHSGRFWHLVSKLIPNYLTIKKELKLTGLGMY